MENTFNNGSIELKQKLNFKFLLNPTLFPYTYINIQQSYQTLSSYKKITEDFILSLPKYDGLILRLHPSFKNPLPFIWKGFTVKPRFTFRIDLTQKPSAEKHFKDTLKRQIKAAQKSLIIKNTKSVENLYALKSLDHQQRNVPLDFSKTALENFSKPYFETDNGFVLEAYLEDECVAAILIIIHQKESIYLVGAANPEHRKSKALSLLLANAIAESKTKATVFDFEGSMEPGIARFFSTFGAECVPYYQIEHFPNKLAKAAVAAKKLFG